MNKIVYVNHYLKNNPDVFMLDDRKEYERYKMFKMFAYSDFILYMGYVLLGNRKMGTSPQDTRVFASTKQKYMFHRQIFLNLGIATLLVVAYRER